MAGRTAPGIIRNGLVLYLDAANPKSYPGSGTTWFDLSGNGNDFTLYNGVSYNSTNGGYLIFDGTNDYCRSINTINFTSYDGLVVELVAKMNNTSIAMIYEHTSNWNSTTGGWGLALNDAADNSSLPNWHHMNWPAGSATRNFNYTQHQFWSFYTNTMMRINDSTGRIFHSNGSPLTLYTGAAGAGGTTNSVSQNTWVFANDYFYIGSRGGGSLFANANIASIKIYNVKLTDSTIQQNYNTTKTRFGL
jgi:hypothetical protein